MWSRMRQLSVLCVTLVLVGCGGPEDVKRPPKVALQDGPGRSVALSTGQTVLAPRVLNPAEELQGLAADGLLRWSAGSDADIYEIWVYRDSQMTQLQEFSASLDSRQYQFTKLQPGQTYYVKLYYRASGSWREIPAFTIATLEKPVKPRLVNPQDEMEAFGVDGVLRWRAISGADSYEVWIYRDAALSTFAETSGPLLISQYQISNLVPGTTYYVQVYGRVNGVWQVGGALELALVQQQDRARMINPQEELDVFAVNGTLRWTEVTGATQYELWIFKDPNVSKIQEGSGTLYTRTYAARTLQPDTVYYAQAFALVNGIWKVGSPVKFTTTSQITPARIVTTQEELEAFGTSSSLTWTPVPGAQGYEVWIYTDAGLGVVAESGSTTTTSYAINRLCAGGTYYVQIYAQVNGAWKVGWATRLDLAAGTGGSSNCVPPTPKVKLNASATEVDRGGSVTLSWTSEFATHCTASGAWSGARAVSGQQTLGPLLQKTSFTLRCDGPSRSGMSQATVTVRNRPPVASAGQDQAVTAGSVVTLDGSQSSDANGDFLTYSWRLVSKPVWSRAVLVSPTLVRPSLLTDLAGTYVVELVVGDGESNSPADTVTISAAVGGSTFHYLFGGGESNVYLGCLNCAPSHPDAVCNTNGNYGSTVTSASIWNQVGDYGNPFSPFSSWNTYSNQPPLIIGSDGQFYGYFTRNTSIAGVTLIDSYRNTLNFYGSTGSIDSTRLWACGSYGSPGQAAFIGGSVLKLYGGFGANIYLGCINCLRTSYESICNRTGPYGSEFSLDSIWNDFGVFGGIFGAYSPWNMITGSPPVVMDLNGMNYGYLTANVSKWPRISDSRLTNIVEYKGAGASSVATRHLACGN